MQDHAPFLGHCSGVCLHGREASVPLAQDRDTEPVKSSLQGLGRTLLCVPLLGPGLALPGVMDSTRDDLKITLWCWEDAR